MARPGLAALGLPDLDPGAGSEEVVRIGERVAAAQVELGHVGALLTV